MGYCKKCVKEKNGAKALREVIKLNFNSPFTKEKLRKAINKSNTTTTIYIRNLKDLGLLQHNESRNNYTLVWNDKVRLFCEKYNIRSSKIPEIVKGSSFKSFVGDLKVCEFCGEELPVSEFYHNKINPDGLMGYCKNCIKDKNAANGLKEIIKVMNFDSSFTKEKLNKAINRSNSSIVSYLRDLTDLRLLKHNKSKDNYILVWNDKVRSFYEKYDIQSVKIPGNVKGSSFKPFVGDLKVCEFCGKKLPVSEFYHSKNNPDGLHNNCKKCLKEKNCAKALREVIKVINFNSPFTNEKLKKAINKSNSTIMGYLRELTDLGLLKHNKSKDNYTLIWNNKVRIFIEKYDIQSVKIPENVKSSSFKPYVGDLKVCEFCGKKLPVSEFYHSKNTPDGLHSNCKNCLKERNAANALREVILVVNFNSLFSKEKLIKAFSKSIATLYIRNLKNLGLIEHNNSNDYYILNWNNKMSTFCEKYSIQLPDSTSKVEELNNSLESNTSLNNQILQNEESGIYFNLKLKEIVRKSEIISILSEIEDKISNLELLELLVKPDENDHRKNPDYIIQVKTEVPSEELKKILDNLKSLDNLKIDIINKGAINGKIDSLSGIEYLNLKDKDCEFAIDQINSLLTIESDNQNVQDGKFNILLKRGKTFLETKDYSSSLEQFEDALIINSESREAISGKIESFIGMANSLLDSRKLKQAIEIYDEILNLEKNNQMAIQGKIIALIEMGQKFIQLNDYNEALGSFNAAHNLDPENTSIVMKIREVERMFLEQISI